jgi:hypothetical protein
MTEIIKVDLPAVAGNDVIQVFNNALMQMDDYRMKLYEEGDYESLANGLVNLIDFKNNLSALVQAIESNLYDVLPQKKTPIEGVGLFEKRRSSSKKWDSEQLLNDLVSDKLNNGTGEITPTDVFELIETLKKVLPLTQSLGWRTTALKEENIDVDQYVQVTYGRPTVQVTK